MAAWKIRLPGKRYVVVFIWESAETLQKKCSDYTSADAIGLAHSGISGIGANHKPLIPKKFGEIHLIENKYGAGLVAHEIQHMVNYWINRIGWNVDVHDEKIARVTMRLTTDFWRAHYKVYQ